MLPLILRVDVTGQPMEWMPWQSAVVLYAKDAVVWSDGDETVRIRGGRNRFTGTQSYIDLHPVIAARGISRNHTAWNTPPLTNRELFRRDHHICLYCLRKFSEGQLTRDHVYPVSRGGANLWTNVVTACQACNQKKAARTPDEANMKLFAVPYTPNYAEWLILKNRRIRADQMSFLQAHCPKDSPWRR